jgi:RimJ/RimL family protein N-acetyltransferase
MGEPWGFGDAEAIWRLLDYATGWWTVDAPAATAQALGAVMERETGRPARNYGDVYYTLTRPAQRAGTPEVRRLRRDDEPLMARYMGTPHWSGSEGFEPIAAGAVIDGRLVGLAHVSAITEHHADIGVSTLEPWRGRGFATAAASIVAQAIQEGGRTPVWSAGEGNAASLRVAAKLGFEEVSRRVYVSLADGT